MIDRIDLMNHKCLSNLTLFCIAVKHSKEPQNDTSSIIFYPFNAVFDEMIMKRIILLILVCLIITTIISSFIHYGTVVFSS